MKLRTFWTVGGGAPGAPSLGSANDQVLHFRHTKPYVTPSVLSNLAGTVLIWAHTPYCYYYEYDLELLFVEPKLL